MRRTKEEAAQTKAEILEAALKEFSQSGYEAARLEDIAAAAGVTRGAIYHHFDSKADLYLALIDEAAAKGNQAINQAIQEGGSLTEIIARILTDGMKLLEEDPQFRRVTALSLFQATNAPDLKVLEERRALEATQLVEGIQGFFQQGIEQGELRNLNPATMARAFLAYQNGLALLWLSNTSAFSIKEKSDELANIFLQGIVKQGG